MERIALIVIILLALAGVAQGQVLSQRVNYTDLNPPTACVPGHLVTNKTTQKVYLGKSDGSCKDVTGGGGGSGGSDTQVQFNDGGTAFGGDAGLTYNKTSNVLTNTGGQIVSPQGTLTTSTPFISHTATWNDAGATFQNIVSNVTDNGSDIFTSRLLNLQVGGTSVFQVRKDGTLFIDRQGSDAALIIGAAGPRIYSPNGNGLLYLGSAGLTNEVHIDAGSVFMVGAGSDATKTDNTLCIDSSTGQVYKGSGTIGICVGTSSLRYKNHVQDLKGSMSRIMALRTRSFFYNKGYGDGGAQRNFGFAAEEAPKAYVGNDASGKPNSVDLVKMIPDLVGVVQQQQKQIDALKREVRRLKHRR